MSKFLRLFPAILTIHDGGAAPAPAGDAAGQAAEGTTGESTSQAGLPIPGSSRRGKTGETQKVIYGKQTEAGAPDAGDNKETQPQDRKAEYAKFKEQYKDLFSDDTQQIINRRFKETKGLQEQIEALKPLIETLSTKYNVTDGDPIKLVEAFENDSAIIEELAEDAGLSVEQYKQVQKLERENKELKIKQQQADAIRQANARRDEWVQQAEALKALYPNFDLNAEISGNQAFTGMLAKGVDVKTAYQAVHFEEITAGLATTAGQRAEANVTSAIQVKGRRPQEAGVSNTPAAIVKNDVNKLSKADRAEIARRVARGEKISF